MTLPRTYGDPGHIPGVSECSSWPFAGHKARRSDEVRCQNILADGDDHRGSHAGSCPPPPWDSAVTCGPCRRGKAGDAPTFRSAKDTKQPLGAGGPRPDLMEWKAEMGPEKDPLRPGSPGSAPGRVLCGRGGGGFSRGVMLPPCGCRGHNALHAGLPGRGVQLGDWTTEGGCRRCTPGACTPPSPVPSATSGHIPT